MACPTAQRVGTYGATTASLCLLRPCRTGSRLGGKKAQARMGTAFLDWALADFSGYVAADELSDGPFCILSAVDNRRYKRLLYDVLDHDPGHPFNAGHPASSITCREGLTMLPWHGQRVDL